MRPALPDELRWMRLLKARPLSAERSRDDEIVDCAGCGASLQVTTVAAGDPPGLYCCPYCGVWNARAD